MIIGLSGYAQSGKDTLGSFLVEDHGFTRYAFADALKKVVYVLNPIIGATTVIWVPPYGPDETALELTRFQDVVDKLGWEEAKKIPEIRRLLQVMGTEAGRQVLGDNVWVDAVFNQVKPGDDIVITDCRFPNEAQEVKAQGGYVVRIERPGIEAINAHASETALDEWGFDYKVINEGSLEALQAKAADLLRGLKRYDTVLTPSVRLPGYGSPVAKAQA